MGKQFDEVIDRLNKISSLLEAQAPQPLTLSEAAAYIHVSKQTLYRMSSKSEIVHYKPSGKRLYFLKADLDAFLTRNKVTAVEH